MADSSAFNVPSIDAAGLITKDMRTSDHRYAAATIDRCGAEYVCVIGPATHFYPLDTSL